MADFNGEDANGTWTITISDNATGDTGTLVDWELIITPAAIGTCEVCPANADVSIVRSPERKLIPTGVARRVKAYWQRRRVRECVM
jgi:hypothetical protein